jgi:hypothetical protein
VHKPDIVQRGSLIEATASAMAQPAKITTAFGKKSGVYGVLSVEATQLHLSTWQLNRQLEQATISLSDWAFSQ